MVIHAINEFRFVNNEWKHSLPIAVENQQYHVILSNYIPETLIAKKCTFVKKILKKQALIMVKHAYGIVHNSIVHHIQCKNIKIYII